MKSLKVILPFVLTICLATQQAHADTVRLSTRPNAQVSFDVSVSGATRISVIGHRIANIRQSSSNYELFNDEDTGDVFLRFGGGQPERETGHIITESGHTIGFLMVPKVALETQTVLITLNGVPSKTTATNQPSTGVAARAGDAGFAVNSGGNASSRTAKLVQFARQAYASRIGNRSPASLRAGEHRTYAAGGLTARILVASASGNQPPAERQFYRSSKTMAVFVDRVVYAGKVWVIVVEASQ